MATGKQKSSKSNKDEVQNITKLSSKAQVAVTTQSYLGESDQVPPSAITWKHDERDKVERVHAIFPSWNRQEIYEVLKANAFDAETVIQNELDGVTKYVEGWMNVNKKDLKKNKPSSPGFTQGEGAKGREGGRGGRGVRGGRGRGRGGRGGFPGRTDAQGATDVPAAAAAASQEEANAEQKTDQAAPVEGDQTVDVTKKQRKPRKQPQPAVQPVPTAPSRPLYSEIAQQEKKRQQELAQKKAQEAAQKKQKQSVINTAIATTKQKKQKKFVEVSEEQAAPQAAQQGAQPAFSYAAVTRQPSAPQQPAPRQQKSQPAAPAPAPQPTEEVEQPIDQSYTEDEQENVEDSYEGQDQAEEGDNEGADVELPESTDYSANNLGLQIGSLGIQEQQAQQTFHVQQAPQQEAPEQPTATTAQQPAAQYGNYAGEEYWKNVNQPSDLHHPYQHSEQIPYYYPAHQAYTEVPKQDETKGADQAEGGVKQPVPPYGKQFVPYGGIPHTYNQYYGYVPPYMIGQYHQYQGYPQPGPAGKFQPPAYYNKNVYNYQQAYPTAGAATAGAPSAGQYPGYPTEEAGSGMAAEYAKYQNMYYMQSQQPTDQTKGRQPSVPAQAPKDVGKPRAQHEEHAYDQRAAFQYPYQYNYMQAYPMMYPAQQQYPQQRGAAPPKTNQPESQWGGYQQ